MKIEWLIADFVYIVFIVLIFGLVPASFVTGQPTTSVNANEITDTMPDEFTATSSIGTFSKILKLFFITWNADGMPSAIGLIIAALNWISIFIPVVWFYDKIRGIE